MKDLLNFQQCNFSGSSVVTWEDVNVSNVGRSVSPKSSDRPLLVETFNTGGRSFISKEIGDIILKASKRTRFHSQYLRSITELSFLNDNWDSYGAPKPESAAIKNANAILSPLSEAQFEPAKIMPSVEGGICFLFVSGNKYADIECDNDGDIIAGMSDRKNEPVIWQVKNNRADVIQSIEKIKNFLERKGL